MRPRSQNRMLKVAFVGGGFALLVLYFFLFQYGAPNGFPKNTTIAVPSGKGLTQIAEELKEKQVIQSPFWFTNFVMLLKQERQIVSGEYYFDQPANVYEVARRLAKGDFQVEQMKTTIPEGSSVFDVSNILLKNYPDFDSSKFILLAKEKEGHLFPDTYKFGTHVKPETVIKVMTDNFNKKINQQEIQDALKDTNHSLEDIITMASILEGEARQTRTRQVVAGILWNRIKLGIPLQVDAAFRYVNGKTTEQLTMDDLKIDSPYNTYVYKGLPPTPISSPGLDSIMAAMTPIATDYLYFLTDKEGNMHYSETLDEHERKAELYLR